MWSSSHSTTAGSCERTLLAGPSARHGVAPWYSRREGRTGAEVDRQNSEEGLMAASNGSWSSASARPGRVAVAHEPNWAITPPEASGSSPWPVEHSRRVAGRSWSVRLAQIRRGGVSAKDRECGPGDRPWSRFESRNVRRPERIGRRRPGPASSARSDDRAERADPPSTARWWSALVPRHARGPARPEGRWRIAGREAAPPAALTGDGRVSAAKLVWGGSNGPCRRSPSPIWHRDETHRRGSASWPRGMGLRQHLLFLASILPWGIGCSVSEPGFYRESMTREVGVRTVKHKKT